MKIRRALFVVSTALISSQAFTAPHWVTTGTVARHTFSIAMNYFPQGIDGLVYFQDSDDGGNSYLDRAVDCQQRMAYVLGGSGSNDPDWRNKGTAVVPHSLGEAELNIACANAGSGPLPGHWVAIDFGISVDKDSIRRGSDGLVHLMTSDSSVAPGPDAADCEKRLIYFGQGAGWQDRGLEVAPGSFAEAELNYACANVR